MNDIKPHNMHANESSHSHISFIVYRTSHIACTSIDAPLRMPELPLKMHATIRRIQFAVKMEKGQQWKAGEMQRIFITLPRGRQIYILYNGHKQHMV